MLANSSVSLTSAYCPPLSSELINGTTIPTYLKPPSWYPDNSKDTRVVYPVALNSPILIYLLVTPGTGLEPNNLHDGWKSYEPFPYFCSHHTLNSFSSSSAIYLIFGFPFIDGRLNSAQTSHTYSTGLIWVCCIWIFSSRLFILLSNAFNVSSRWFFIISNLFWTYFFMLSILFTSTPFCGRISQFPFSWFLWNVPASRERFIVMSFVFVMVSFSPLSHTFSSLNNRPTDFFTITLKSSSVILILFISYL